MSKESLKKESSKVLGNIKLQKRVLAARRNGKKGGRPKKEEVFPEMYCKTDMM